jgi:hypothetical protein
LISNVLQIEKNAKAQKVYVNVSRDHFEIIVIENAKLMLYNTFKHQTKEDFIYFILFTAEQLNLNPETIELVFIGDITKDNDLYKIAYKYIRQISFGKRYDNYKYEIQPKSEHSNFALIKSF